MAELNPVRLKPASPARWWDSAVVALVLATFAFVFSLTKADPDLWGHLKFGQDLWRTGQIVRADSYSYLTGDRPWINHEWLTEALIALAYAAAGGTGLVVLKILLILAAASLIYAHLCRRGLTTIGAGILLLYVWLLILPWLGSLRPQLVTYLCFALLLVIVDRAEREDARRLWLAAPLLGVWANLHGGFLAGAGVLAIWAAARFVIPWLQVDRSRWNPAADARAILPPVGAALLATLANPYGVRLWTFLRTAVVSRLEIAEWNPVEVASIEGIAHFVVLAPAVAGWLWSRRERRPALFALFASLAILPLVARRNTPLFALATLVLAGEHIADVCERVTLRTIGADAPATPRVRRLAAAVFGAGALAMLIASAPHFRRVEVERSFYPVQAIALLKTSGVTGNLAIFFDWGEYALWHLSPALRISMDGRRETAYPDAAYAAHMAFTFGTGQWDAVLGTDVDVALVSRRFPTYNLMKLKPGWTLIFEDELSALFAPADSPHLDSLRRLAADVRLKADTTRERDTARVGEADTADAPLSFP